MKLMSNSSDLSMLSMNRKQTHEFADLKNKARDEKKLKEVAKEFETLFIEMMFKEMKKTVNKESMFGESGPGQEIFNGMLNTEYAREAAKSGGFGLAKMIEESIKPQIQERSLYKY